jgi:hypothetical protein
MSTPDLLVKLRFCTVELYLRDQLVVTRFFDGTEAHACPHDTPEYHHHALQKTGLDDVMRYCWQHDLAHNIVAEMKGKPSVVLWRLAHGLDTETDECAEEEVCAQTLQRNMQMTQ